ncbi:MAG: hypothetical protein HY055_18060 [Magnetospirillum sp.]|nr:hypothetical protein [Magnetospirillum sp.]
MPDYTARTPIKTADSTVSPGEPITLDAKAAKELAAIGAIDPNPVKKTDKKGDGGTDGAATT